MDRYVYDLHCYDALSAAARGAGGESCPVATRVA